MRSIKQKQNIIMLIRVELEEENEGGRGEEGDEQKRENCVSDGKNVRNRKLASICFIKCPSRARSQKRNAREGARRIGWRGVGETSAQCN